MSYLLCGQPAYETIFAEIFVRGDLEGVDAMKNSLPQFKVLFLSTFSVTPTRLIFCHFSFGCCKQQQLTAPNFYSTQRYT